MKTNDIVINKIINWLEAEDKSYEWLAEQLDVSKGLVGFKRRLYFKIGTY
ncbi:MULTISPECIES: hypothetical protein [unclassified Lysinibacillus]|nr:MULTISPECIES: hypothetical protein [unclassified Lysinibacillus]MCL1697056.1 hypothetical protein [Lysinibacillus sp. BPa_S21]MCL1701776.1 hypothetical protein [Lysinibacillus sp. Bpr_S20]